jgi:hypothetical protein
MAGAPRFTGAAMARALSHALERPVVHRDPPPAVYRSFGFTGADDLGNFKWRRSTISMMTCRS